MDVIKQMYPKVLSLFDMLLEMVTIASWRLCGNPVVSPYYLSWPSYIIQASDTDEYRDLLCNSVVGMQRDWTQERWVLLYQSEMELSYDDVCVMMVIIVIIVDQQSHEHHPIKGWYQYTVVRYETTW